MVRSCSIWANEVSPCNDLDTNMTNTELGNLYCLSSSRLIVVHTKLAGLNLLAPINSIKWFERKNIYQLNQLFLITFVLVVLLLSYIYMDI